MFRPTNNRDEQNMKTIYLTLIHVLQMQGFDGFVLYISKQVNRTFHSILQLTARGPTQSQHSLRISSSARSEFHNVSTGLCPVCLTPAENPSDNTRLCACKKVSWGAEPDEKNRLVKRERETNRDRCASHRRRAMPLFSSPASSVLYKWECGFEHIIQRELSYIKASMNATSQQVLHLKHHIYIIAFIKKWMMMSA